MTGAVAATAFVSLSAGPLIALIVQGLLLSWNSLFRTIKIRWKILTGLLVVIYLSVEIFANRSLPAIVSSYLTFDVQSYWYRLLIWDYGSAVALNHPFFGVGSNDWERPDWMPSSIDNFWLFLAVRQGLPASFLMLLALLSIFLAVSFKKGLDEDNGVSHGFSDYHDGVFRGQLDRNFLGRYLCSLSISDGQRRLDARCRDQGESCLAFASTARSLQSYLRLARGLLRPRASGGYSHFPSRFRRHA
jgi:hypothetical protein